jgi:uncharacterized protein YegP (UPF0339 family)
MAPEPHETVIPPRLVFERFRDKAGQHRFRIVAANGEIVAQSEAYERAVDRDKTIGLIQAKASIAAVVDVEG